MKRPIDRNAWIEKIPPAYFPAAIREVFDFLCHEFSFREPLNEQTSLTLCQSYRAQRIGIEVAVDFRDLEVEVSLVWLNDGERPEGWKVDSSGRQFMTRLYEAAWFRKTPNPRVVVPADSSPESTLRLWLDAWAEQLRVQFADVLADSDALFYDLNKARRKP